MKGFCEQERYRVDVAWEVLRLKEEADWMDRIRWSLTSEEHSRVVSDILGELETHHIELYSITK